MKYVQHSYNVASCGIIFFRDGRILHNKSRLPWNIILRSWNKIEKSEQNPTSIIILLEYWFPQKKPTKLYSCGSLVPFGLRPLPRWRAFHRPRSTFHGKGLARGPPVWRGAGDVFFCWSENGAYLDTIPPNFLDFQWILHQGHGNFM